MEGLALFIEALRQHSVLNAQKLLKRSIKIVQAQNCYWGSIDNFKLWIMLHYSIQETCVRIKKVEKEKIQTKRKIENHSAKCYVEGIILNRRLFLKFISLKQDNYFYSLMICSYGDYPMHSPSLNMFLESLVRRHTQFIFLALRIGKAQAWKNSHFGLHCDYYKVFFLVHISTGAEYYKARIRNQLIYIFIKIINLNFYILPQIIKYRVFNSSLFLFQIQFFHTKYFFMASANQVEEKFSVKLILEINIPFYCWKEQNRTNNTKLAKRLIQIRQLIDCINITKKVKLALITNSVFILLFLSNYHPKPQSTSIPQMIKPQSHKITNPQNHSLLQEQFQISDELLRKYHSRNHKKSVHKKQRYLKLVCIAFLLSGFFYYRFGSSLNINTGCILDAYQEYTFGINRKLAEGWDNAFIGIGQVIMDGWIVSSAVFWQLFGLLLQVRYFLMFRMVWIKNFRLPGAISMFYLIRSIIMTVQKFPFPQNMVWHNPGFASLTVPYDHTRDFFFSGHTGSLTIILLEFSQLTVNNGKKIAGYVWVLAFICLIYMMNMLIITRVHYTADIMGGLIFSVYFYWVTCIHLDKIDKLASLPYSIAIKPLLDCFQVRRQRNNQIKNRKENQQSLIIDDRLMKKSQFQQQK